MKKHTLLFTIFVMFAFVVGCSDNPVSTPTPPPTPSEYSLSLGHPDSTSYAYLGTDFPATSKNFSFSFWIKADAASGYSSYIFHRAIPTGGNVVTTNLAIVLSERSVQTLFRPESGAGSGIVSYSHPSKLPENVWSQFVITISTNADSTVTITHYLNGTLLGKFSSVKKYNTFIDQTPQPMTMGHWVYNGCPSPTVKKTSVQLVANISNFAIYDRVLTESEISALQTGKPTGAYRFWDFNNTLKDWSGRGDAKLVCASFEKDYPF